MFTACKTPLTYPGGKTRAVDALTAHLPAGITRMVSPFIGGASFEIATAAAGVTVLGYDVFVPLVNFWQQTLANAGAVADVAHTYHAGDRSTIRTLHRTYDDLPTDIAKAGAFYVLSRTSFSALIMHSGIDPHKRNFRSEHITERLAPFVSPNLTVALSDFADTIAAHPDDFLYLDPPYDIMSPIYGRGGCHHRGFQHHTLAKLLTGRSNWMLSYNDCPRIRLFYEGYRYTTPEWQYSMRRYRTSNELLIFSHDLDLPNDYPTLTWST